MYYKDQLKKLAHGEELTDSDFENVPVRLVQELKPGKFAGVADFGLKTVPVVVFVSPERVHALGWLVKPYDVKRVEIDTLECAYVVYSPFEKAEKNDFKDMFDYSWSELMQYVDWYKEGENR